jgi:hypothetical protein
VQSGVKKDGGQLDKDAPARPHPESLTEKRKLSDSSPL